MLDYKWFGAHEITEVDKYAQRGAKKLFALTKTKIRLAEEAGGNPKITPTEKCMDQYKKRY